ncbi:glutathione transferase [Chitinimonas naiadis]
MTTPTLTLYTDNRYISPYAMSAFVALQEKGLSFELKTLDLATAQYRDPAYAATSLTQRVPTLVHDGFALSESSAITEYISEVFPGASLYPADPRQRARARQVQAWIRSDLMPIRNERSTEVVFYRPSSTPLSADAQVSAAKLFAAADALLKDGADYLCDDWCIADVDLALMLNRLVLNGDAVPAKLADYAKRQWQRPSVQAWVNKDRPAL